MRGFVIALLVAVIAAFLLWYGFFSDEWLLDASYRAIYGSPD